MVTQHIDPDRYPRVTLESDHQMPKVTLTDAAVRRYKAGETRVDYFDNAIPGFALRVSPATPRTPAGFRSWVLFYRMAGQQKRLTLGNYPETSLAEAREKAVLARRKVAANEDPTTTSRRAHTAAAPETVADVVDLFMRRYMEHGRRSHSPRYIAEVRRNFHNHVLPAWGGRAMNSIQRRDVNALLDSIVEFRQTRCGKPGSGIDQQTFQLGHRPRPARCVSSP